MVMTSSTLRRRRNIGDAEFKKNHPSLQCMNEYNVVVNQLADCADLSVTQPRDDDPEENRDLISQLPDEILIKILGYVPISCATSTSILSTRWRNLYKQVCNIDLNSATLLRRIPVDCGSKFLSQKTSWTNLPKFVSKIEWGIGYVMGCHHTTQLPHYSPLVVDSLDRFLSLRSGSKIHSASLNCCLDFLVSTRFEQCIHSLGRLGIEKLVLQCRCCCESIPACILDFYSKNVLNMPSLKYLDLGGCYLVPNLSGQCNSLQTLVLDHVTLPRGALECILSNCSSLHALTVVRCGPWPSRLTIRGPNLQLKYLHINTCGEIDVIELCASKLVVFKFTNYNRTVNFIFDHVPELQSFCLSTHSKDIPDYVCGKLANDLPHLKSFEFVGVGCYIQGSSIGIDRFSNLRRLDLTLRTLCSEHNRPPQEKRQDIVFHSELKKVEISGFVGMENDIEFALYVLKSAIKLEEMHITPCKKECMRFGKRNLVYEHGLWSEERQRMILTRLQGQAISKTAQLFLPHKHQIISAIELDCGDYVRS